MSDSSPFELLPVGLIRTDFNGQILSANAYARNLFAMADASGKFCHLPSVVSMGLAPYWQQAKSTNEAAVDELPWLKNGEIFYITCGFVRTPDAIEIVFRDVTSQRNRNKESDAISERLLQSAKWAEIGQLLAGVTHELNNPIANINATTELLRYKLTKGLVNDESLTSSIEQIELNLDRMSTLTAELLGYARPKMATWSQVSMPEEISKFVGFLHHVANEFNVEIRHNVTVSSYACIAADIERIVVNLCTNAIHACAESNNPVVELAVVPGGISGIRIEVRDNGPGLQTKSPEKVWEPFYSTKERGRGTGLGLPIVRMIAEQYGGNVSLERTDEQTIFSVSLPKQDRQPDTLKADFDVINRTE